MNEFDIGFLTALRYVREQAHDIVRLDVTDGGDALFDWLGREIEEYQSSVRYTVNG